MGGALIGPRILGDLGADVIVVEPPAGHPSRRLGPFAHDDPGLEQSLFWWAYAANKRSLTLDLAAAQGRDLFLDLIATADVLIESRTPGELAGLGLGSDALRGANPRLIQTSVTPFGQTGPYAHHRASDLTAWAMGAYGYLTGDPDRPPVWIGQPQAWLHGGVEAATASLMALWHREAGGEAQRVDVSLQQCVIWILMNTTGYADLLDYDFHRGGGVITTPNYTMPVIYDAADGSVVCHLSGGAKEGSLTSSRALVQLMDEAGMAPDWLRELDWRTYDATRLTQETVDRVSGAVATFFRTQTKQFLYEAAIARRIMLAPVSTVAEVRANAQLAARDFWQTPPAGAGEAAPPALPGPFVKMSGTPLALRRRAPRRGEHVAEILCGGLGLSPGDLTVLRGAGVV